MLVNKVPGQSRFLVSAHCLTHSPNFLKRYVSAGDKYSLFVSREGIAQWAVSAFPSYLFSTAASVWGMQRHRHPAFHHNIRMKTKSPLLGRAKLQIVHPSASIWVTWGVKACLVITWCASDQQVQASLAGDMRISTCPSAIWDDPSLNICFLLRVC